MNTPTNWRQQLTDLGGYENEMLGVPAGGVRKMVDEIEQLRAKLAEITSEQLETRRKHQEDYEALHDAVAERNELRAKLAALEGQPMTDTVAQVAGYASPPLVLSVALCAEDIKAIYAWRTAIEAHHGIGAREAQPLKGADWTITMRRMLVAGKCARRECRCAPENAERCIWWDEPDDAPKPLRAKLATKPMTEAEARAVLNDFDIDSPVEAVRAVEAHHGIGAKPWSPEELKSVRY